MTRFQFHLAGQSLAELTSKADLICMASKAVFLVFATFPASRFKTLSALFDWIAYSGRQFEMLLTYPSLII